MKQELNNNFIPLREAAEYSGYSPEYLNLRVRQGKLKAVKIGRNWVTKKEWIDGYMRRVEEYKNHIANGKKSTTYQGVYQKQKPAIVEMEKQTEIQKETETQKEIEVQKEPVESAPTFTPPIPHIPATPVSFFRPALRPRTIAIILAMVFVLISVGTTFAYPYLEPVRTFVVEQAKDITANIGEGITAFGGSLSKSTASIKDVKDQLGRYISQDIKIIKKFTKDVSKSIFNALKKAPQKIVSFFKGKEEEAVSRDEIMERLIKFQEEQKELGGEGMGRLKEIIQEIKGLKEGGIPTREIVKEIKQITQVQPIKEITKEITKIDDRELKKLQSQIAKIQTWEKDIKTLQTLTTKLQTHPPQTQVSTAPVYIGSQGLQVGGAGTFSSLVVSGPVGIANLGVGDSTSLGSDASDRLTVHATANFLSPTTFSSTLTVGDSTNYLIIGSTGDLTTTGNVSISGDLTVSGTQSLNAPLTITTTTQPQLRVAYDDSNYFTTAVSLAGATALTSTGGLNLSGAAASTWETIDASLTIQTSTSTATTTHLYLTSASNLIQTFATSSIFTLYQGQTARLAIDTSGNLDLTGTNISLTGDTTLTGALQITATTTLATTTITRLTVGATTSPNLFTVTGSGNALFQNQGTLTLSPTSTLTLSSATTTTIGSATSTPLVFTSYLKSDIVSFADNQYSLGSPSYRWANLYTATTTIGNTIIIDTSTITATSTNLTLSTSPSSDIILTPGTGGKTAIGTTTPTTTLDIWGTQGTHLLNIASSTGESLFVIRDNGYVGIGTTSPSETLSVIGNIVGTGGITLSSDIMPSAPKTGSIGSAAYDWQDIYAANVYADNIFASTSTLASTKAETFTINSDALNDATSTLRFYRGVDIPHALITWEAANDHFDFNFPVYFSGTASLTSASALTIESASTLTVTSTNTFSLVVAGTERFNIDTSGNITLTGGITFSGSSTTTGELVVQATTTLATTTITRLTVGATTSPNLFTVAGAGNAVFQNKGTLTFSPTSTLTLSSATTTTIGSSTSTSLVFTSYIKSDVIPYIDDQYDLGSPSYRWQDTYSVAGHFGGTIDITTNKIDASSALTIESGATTTVTSTGNIIFSIAGQERVRFDTSGRVGIGTTSPTTTLDIWGTQGTHLFNIASSTGESLLVVRDDGNVGIGTTVPIVNLHILDSGTNSQATIWLDGFNDQVLYSPELRFRKSHTDTAGSDVVTIDTEVLGAIKFLGVDSGNVSDVGAIIQAEQDGAAGATIPTNLIFETYSSTAVNSNQLVIHNSGNVGIATTSPQYPLHVWGDAAFGTTTTPTLFVDADTGRVGIGTTTPSQQLEITKNFELPNTLAGENYGVIYKDGSRFIHNYTAAGSQGENTFIGINSGNFTMATSGQVHQASKNTGVGQYTLDALTTGYQNSALGSNVLTANTSGAANSALGYFALYYNVTGDYNSALGHSALFFNQHGDSNVAIGYGAGYGQGYSDHYRNIFIGYQAGNSVYTGSDNIIIGYDEDLIASTTSNFLNIGGTIYGDLNLGKIGIGTTTPAYTLDVYGTLRAIGTTTLATTGGNVGIGTTTPSETLTVVGNIWGSGNIVLASASASSTLTTSTLIFSGAGDITAGDTSIWKTETGSLTIQSAGALTIESSGDLTVTSSDNIIFTSAGTEIMRIASSTGYVGIGTTTPAEKLTLAEGNFLQIPGNPVHKGAIDDNATTSLNGPYSIYVSGKYAYVTALVDNGVEILDISDPANPTHVGAIFDAACDAAVGGNGCALNGPRSIYVSGKYAYVASEHDNGVEILDISDPANPTHVGAIFDKEATTTYVLVSPQSIYVSGKYAYVVSHGDSGVEILDISDPANPTHVGSIVNTGATELNGPRSIYVSGKYAYIAANSDHGVEILDISDPANPTHVGAIDNAVCDAAVGGNGCALLQAWFIYVSGKYAYVASYGDNGVEILDISDPANPTHVGAIFDKEATTTYALDNPRSIYVSGKYAYVASYDDDGVEILDISDPTNPTHVGAITDAGATELNGATSIYVSGKYAYVAGYEDDGVEILDISGIDVPSAHIGDLSVSTIDVTDNVIVGNNLYAQGGLNVGPGGIYSGGPLSILSAASSASTSALTIDNLTGATLFYVRDDGNVGIGTTSPATTLQIVGTTTARTILPEADVTYTLGSPTYRWANLYAATTTIGGTIIIDTSTIAATSTDLTISTGPSSDIILTPGTAGRVGIGTTSPTTYFAIATSSNTALFTVTDDGNVGIGTTTPGGKLHVGAGDILLDNVQGLNIKDSGGTARSAVALDISNQLTVGDANLGSMYFQTGNAAMYFYNNGTYRAVLDTDGLSINNDATGPGSGNGLIVASGDVGISTTSPRSLLDVWGDVSLGTTTDSSTPILFVDSSAGRLGIGTTTPTTYFAIATSSNTALLTVTDDGNVGIGTAGPSVPFEVNASVVAIAKFSSSLAANDNFIRIDASATDSGAGIFMTNSNAGKNTGVGVKNPGTGLLQFTTGNTAIEGPYAANVRMTIDTSGRVGIGTTSPTTTLEIWGTQGTHPFNIASSTGESLLTVRDDGNVGIGTADPKVLRPDLGTDSIGSMLEIRTSRTSGTSATALVISDAVTGAQTPGYGGVIQWNSSAGAAITEIMFGSSGDGTTNQTEMRFRTQPSAGSLSDRMIINHAGYVGIGTTSPDYLLHSWGDSAFGTGTTPTLFIDANGGTGQGYVGIGTAAPNTTLEVQGTDGELTLSDPSGTIIANDVLGSLLFRSYDGSYAGAYAGVAGGIKMIATKEWGGADDKAWSDLAFFTSGTSVGNPLSPTEQMRITSQGNVGIGTTSPGDTLQVQAATNEGIRLGDTAGQATNATTFTDLATLGPVISFSRSSDGAWDNSVFSYMTTGNAESHLGIASRHDIVFAAGATGSINAERVRIDSSGNVGIGITDPQFSLDLGSATVGGNDLGWSTGTSSQYGAVGTMVSNAQLFLGRCVESSPGNANRLDYSTTVGLSKGAVVLDEAGIFFATKAAAAETIGNEFAWASTYARMTIGNTGNVGIGTEGPVGRLSIQGTGCASTVWGQNADFNVKSSEFGDDAAHPVMQIAVVRQSLTTGKASEGYIGFSSIDDSNNSGVYDAARIQLHNESDSAVLSPTSLSFWTNSSPASNVDPASEVMRLTSTGNVIVGTLGGSGDRYVYTDNAGTLKIGGAYPDYAEYFPVKEGIEEGDVVVMTEDTDPETKEDFILEKSSKPYDDKLVGVISVEGTPAIGPIPEGENYLPVGLAGRVPVKVSIENGAIEIGDSLTSASSTPGAAMKATRAGRVIGIALGSYNDEGIGKVLVFINPHWQGQDLTVQENGGGEIVNISPEVLRTSLASLGLQVTENGSLEVQKLKATKVVAEEFEMRDKATSEIYCTWIENGEWVKTKGECEYVNGVAAAASTSEPETIIDSHPEALTASIDASFTFHCDKEECTFQCQINNQGFIPCTSPKEYVNLTPNNYTFEVFAVDSLGNYDPTPAVFSWVIEGGTQPESEPEPEPEPSATVPETTATTTDATTTEEIIPEATTTEATSTST